jgi:hypothetical protein
MARFIGGATYDEPSAADARGRIEAFFERHLKAEALRRVAWAVTSDEDEEAEPATR